VTITVCNRVSISGMRFRGVNASLALLVLFGSAVVATRSAQAQTFSVLHAFAGTPDGAFPYAGLIRDSAGNFYGTTTAGGGTGCGVGCGTVFKLDASGKEKVLFSFTGGSGGERPYGSLIRNGGNLYGTASFGGDLSCNAPFGCGIVFKLDKTGKKKVLHRFTGGRDGAFPYAGLIRDSAGNLYGTTEGGLGNGVSSYGTVFKLDETGKEKVLHRFTGGTDGGYPLSRLIEDSAGSLYGTTFSGGDLNCGNGVGCGVVFKLDKTGKEKVLYSFTGGVDGGQPYAGLVRDGAGNLYGTTYGIGTSFYGTVFKLDKTGKETVLHQFTSQPDGSFPKGGLVRDAAGNLYGTTTSGGAINTGTVFKLDKTGKEKVLYSFTGEGGSPSAGLLRDAAGNLYGTTVNGGDPSCNCGVVFKLTP
jgi:uncharacterized repeat protein (TIGR03803 family)